MVYILVLNWNNWDATRDCLEALLKQDYPDYKIILPDNGSADFLTVEKNVKKWAFEAGAGFISYTRHEAESGGRPEEKAKGPGTERPFLVFIQNGENLGYAGGNNVGLRYALKKNDFEYVWLLNNDTVPEESALSALVSCAQKNQAAMAGSKLLYADAPEKEKPKNLQMAGGGMIWPAAGNAFIMGAGRKDDGQWDKPFPLDYVCGASLLVKKEVLFKVGLLEEKYFLYWEDVEWGIRAGRDGFKRLYCPDSRVLHKEGGTIGKAEGGISGKADYYWVRNGLYFTKKYYPWYLPVVLAAYLAKHTAIRILKRQPLNFRAFVSGLFDFLAGKTGPV